MTLVEPDLSDFGVIPFRLRVGVTGHRKLPEDPEFREQVQAAIERLSGLVHLRYTPVQLAAVSSLAEGADRLVAREVLRNEGAILEVALPFRKADYVKDFPETESEFEDLLGRAAMPALTMDPLATRGEAFEAVGRYVVDHCDVLLALWDGEPAHGRGGTAEIVDYARGQGEPLLWISTQSPFWTSEERLESLPFCHAGDRDKAAEIEEIEAFNKTTATAVWAAEVHRRKDRWQGQLNTAVDHAEQNANRQGSDLTPLCDWILPYWVRASTLARKRQRFTYQFSDLIYVLVTLSALAAAAALLLSLRFETSSPPESPAQLHVLVAVLLRVIPWIPQLEVFALIGVFLLVVAGAHWRVQQRWIAYRILAEHCRTQFFLAVLGQYGSPDDPSGGFYLEHGDYGWLRHALYEVNLRRPRLNPAELLAAELREFVSAAWLEDQRAFYSSRAAQNDRSNKRLTSVILAILAAGLGLAIFDALKAFGPVTTPKIVVALLAIILPVIAAALRGIKAQHEFARISSAYRRMALNMELQRRRMQASMTLTEARTVAADVATLLVSENREWLSMMELHGVEDAI